MRLPDWNTGSGGLGLPMVRYASLPEHCWPHRFGQERYTGSGRRCFDCGGMKCVDSECQHLASPTDLCYSHEIEGHLVDLRAAVAERDGAMAFESWLYWLATTQDVNEDHGLGFRGRR